MSIGDIVDK